MSLLRLHSGAWSKNPSTRGTFFLHNEMSSSRPRRSQELKFLLDPTVSAPPVVPNPYGSKNGCSPAHPVLQASQTLTSWV